MKTSKILFLLPFLIFTINSNTYSQSGNAADFLPLQVGNVWIYQYSAFNVSPPCLASEKIKIKLIGTNVYNGKTYFQSQITRIISPGYGGCMMGFLPYDSLLRVDSASGKVLRYAPGVSCITPNETVLDSLKARLNDSIYEYCQPSPYGNYVCSDTNDMTVFGTNRHTKRFLFSGFEAGWARRYAMGIGLISSNCYALHCIGSTGLLGCVINGVAYGDTGFIVGINKISSEIPKEYSLSQNYPNPFNPKTVIRFQVASDRFVTLKIFDALGKKVETLVSKQLEPGTYEADWDGTNYPSGVYFYQLSVGNEQIATKKMLLVK